MKGDFTAFQETKLLPNLLLRKLLKILFVNPGECFYYWARGWLVQQNQYSQIMGGQLSLLCGRQKLFSRPLRSRPQRAQRKGKIYFKGEFKGA
jgi:hypothetical protein